MIKNLFRYIRGHRIFITRCLLMLGVLFVILALACKSSISFTILFTMLGSICLSVFVISAYELEENNVKINSLLKSLINTNKTSHNKTQERNE